MLHRRVAVSDAGTFGAVVDWHAGVQLQNLATGAVVPHALPDEHCADACFVAACEPPVLLVAYYHGGHGVHALHAVDARASVWKRFEDQHVMSVSSGGSAHVFVCSRAKHGGDMLVTAWEFGTGWLLHRVCVPMSMLGVHTLSAFPLTRDGNTVLLTGARMAYDARTDTHFRSHTCFGTLRLDGDAAVSAPVGRMRIAHTAQDGLADHGPRAWGVDAATGGVIGSFGPNAAFLCMPDSTDVRVQPMPDAGMACFADGTLWTLRGAGTFARVPK